MNTQYQIVPGSISALSQSSGKSIAETFVNADCVVIVDCSGSMSSRDSRGGRSRYEVACEELAALQRTMPGKVAVIAFASLPMFCPGGVPIQPGGDTDLGSALNLARLADAEGMRFVLISDGEPNSEADAMSEAKKYRCKINVIYVGDEKNPNGREFLTRLAAATGGQTVTANCAVNLSTSVQKLLVG